MQLVGKGCVQFFALYKLILPAIEFAKKRWGRQTLLFASVA